MPKGRRERLLELHHQATNNVNRALGDLAIMHTAYEIGAPDRAAEIAAFAENLVVWNDTFARFKSERM